MHFNSEKIQSMISEASLLFQKLNTLESDFDDLTGGGSLFAINGYVKSSLAENYNGFIQQKKVFEKQDESQESFKLPSVEDCFFPSAHSSHSMSSAALLERKRASGKGRKRNPDSEEGCRRSLIIAWLTDNPEGGKLREIAAGLENDGFINTRKTDLPKIIYQDMLVLMQDGVISRTNGVYTLN